MDSKKLFYTLVSVLILSAVGLFASVAQANTLLAEHSKTLVDLKAKSKATENQQQQLVQDKKDIAAYKDLNDIAKAVVPQDKDQAKAVREIVNLAKQSGIPKLSTIAFPPSTLGGATGGGSSSTSTGTGSGGSGSSGAATGTTKPKTPAGLTQLTPVKGMAGVYNLQITVTQATADAVPYNNFITFLSKLEQNRRTAQVSSIAIQPDATNPSLISFTLVIDEFVKP